MATSKTPPSDWKAKNYNKKIKVSNKTIADLRAGKTFAGNVAKFKKTGMSAEQREAMNRFYGKSRVDAAMKNGATTRGSTTRGSTPRPSTPSSSTTRRGSTPRAGSTVKPPVTHTPKYSMSADAWRSAQDALNSIPGLSADERSSFNSSFTGPKARPSHGRSRRRLNDLQQQVADLQSRISQGY